MTTKSLPTVFLVGKPNVGKSSIFNKLSHNDSAIISATAGSTLDNKVMWASINDIAFKLVDTAGYMDKHTTDEYAYSQKIAHTNLKSADLVIFVVDNKQGLTSLDFELLSILRKHKHLWLLANKFDHAEDVLHEQFNELGLDPILMLSCKTGYMFNDFRRKLYEFLKPIQSESSQIADDRVRVGIIGKPNAGKSSLVNALLGESVRIVSDAPGTTRDTSEIPFTIHDHVFWLTDTAGVRKKNKISDKIETDAVGLALKSTRQCNIIILLIRADIGLTDQDIKLLELARKGNQGLIIVISQTDRIKSSSEIDELHYQIERIVPYCKALEISIFRPKSLKKIHTALVDCQQCLEEKLQTSHLTKILIDLTTVQPPPRTSVSRIKCRFAHPGEKPRSIIIRGKQVSSIPRSYQKYLYNGFMQRLKIKYSNLSLIFRDDTNPYD